MAEMRRPNAYSWTSRARVSRTSPYGIRLDDSRPTTPWAHESPLPTRPANFISRPRWVPVDPADVPNWRWRGLLIPPLGDLREKLFRRVR